MIDGIDLVYKRIADSILNSIREPWSLAKVSVVFYSDGSDYLAEYTSEKGDVKSFEITLEATRAFRELRRAFKEANQPLWGQVAFEFKADGSFQIKLGYDNIDEDGNTIWDEEAWQLRREEHRARLS